MANIVLPRYQNQLRPLAEAHLKNLTQDQQTRLQTFFNLPPTSLTPKQANVLISKGYSPSILSKQEESDLIDKLSKAPATAPTPRQVDILKEHNISIIGISKQDAIGLIGDIMRSRK